MNLITKAWKALRGKPEVREVVREVAVIGDAHLAKLYQVNVPSEEDGYIETFSGGIFYKKHAPVYYATCEQAHSEHPDKSVSEVKAIRVGTSYFVGKLEAVKAQPKPKRPKGARG